MTDQTSAEHHLAIALLQSLAQADSDDCLPALQQLVAWLRPNRSRFSTAQRMDSLIAVLPAQAALIAPFAERLHAWLCRLQLYPALVELGLFSRRGFARECIERCYERLNPAPLNLQDARDVLRLLLPRASDLDWLEALGGSRWAALFQALCRVLSAESLASLRRHARAECLYALEMLAIWVAAEELDRDLMRLEPSLVERDSAFVALQREIAQCIAQQMQALHEPSPPPCDLAHIEVLLTQCAEQIQRLRRRMVSRGSSIALTHLLERLEQTLARLQQLLDILFAEHREQAAGQAAQLFLELVQAGHERRGIRALWRRNTRLLARSITENTSDHGEHYITRDRSGYLALLRSAGGAGIIIALLALIKIQIGNLGLTPLSSAVLVSLNYGLGFVLVHLLHFTIATKQPAMTAARLAQDIERGERGKANQKRLAMMLVDLTRSQLAAVLGNVLVAVSLAFALAWLYALWQGQALLSSAQVAYQLKAVAPIDGLALWYAAIAGVWLFCSGLLAGYFDNRAACLDLRARLLQHPLLKRLLPSATLRGRLADYLHDNYGALMGNFLFGVMLGMTGYIGHSTGLPLDIRHVAFSSANIGYSAASGSLSVALCAQALGMVLLIGLVNLLVSFTLALRVALKARQVQVGSLGTLLTSFIQQVRSAPRLLLLPPPPLPAADQETDSAPH